MNREELLLKHTKELAAYDAEQFLLAQLPEWARAYSPSIHVHNLYGITASIAFNHDFYAHGKDKPQPKMSTTRRLAKEFPPVPLVMVRDGCLSFRTREHVDALPEEKKARWESETDVCPFLVELDAFQQRTVKFKWPAMLGGQCVEISSTLPHTDLVGRWDLIIRDVKGGRHVERCQFNPASALQTLLDGPEAIAQLESPIKWGSGSPDTPNRFTLYWVHIGDHQATAEHLLAAVLDQPQMAPA